MKKILTAVCCAALLTTSAAAWAGPHGGHHGHGGGHHRATVNVVHHGGHHHGSNLFWGALAGVAVGTMIDGVIQSYRPQRVTYVTPSTPAQNCVTVTNQNTGITTTQCTTM
ncbi:MAG: hypothetical protein II942_02550 [Alphaproteobacteria bacterium]|nr:hypothetical protein [Alphaproteobacteria bacterium]